jgi:hypothetical protein
MIERVRSMAMVSPGSTDKGKTLDCTARMRQSQAHSP